MSSFSCHFDELVANLNSSRLEGDVRTIISSVCYDSRRALPGSLFVALRGGYADGHDFLGDARDRGAVATLAEAWNDDVASFPATAVVDDTRAALAIVAADFYQHPADSLGVIGITGTDGKTTTSFLLDSILRRAGRRTGMIGTVSVRIGDEITDHDTRQTTPESLEIQHLLSEMRAEHVDWSILEATSHGLELHRLDSCPFDVGVVTNITHEHLDFHGTIDAYRRAKARLLESVASSGGRTYPRGVVLNQDDEGARAIAQFAGDAPVIWFSAAGSRADLNASNIHVTRDGTSFDLLVGGAKLAVRLKLIGTYNVANALAAAGAAKLVGIEPEAIVSGLETLDAVPGRLARIVEGQPFSVFVDYAHTPDSIEKTIRLLRSLNDGRMIVVFGSAGERDRLKRATQGTVAARLADFAVFTSEDPRYEDPDVIIDEIARGAVDAGAREGTDFVRRENRQQAIETAFSAARPGDVVLLAGKGHEQCIIYGSERRPWDEASAARTALRALGYSEAGRMGN